MTVIQSSYSSQARRKGRVLSVIETDCISLCYEGTAGQLLSKRPIQNVTLTLIRQKYAKWTLSSIV